METIDYELYKGKTFSGLCKDIVKNAEDKRNQVDILTRDLKDMIKTIADAVMVIPLLKEYYEVGVRNDEQLIKLAAVIQRIITGKMEAGDSSSFLTDEERKQLMSSINETVEGMKTQVPDRTIEIKKIKESQEK